MFLKKVLHKGEEKKQDKMKMTWQKDTNLAQIQPQCTVYFCTKEGFRSSRCRAEIAAFHYFCCHNFIFYHLKPWQFIFFSRCFSSITRGAPCQILSQSTDKIRRKDNFCSASELYPHLSHLCPTLDIDY